MGKRAVLVPINDAGRERSVEISVTPLKSDSNDTLGLVLVLHDTSELRGLTRQMTYQATHDALTGLVNRREFERRLSEAMDSAQTGDAAHALCYLDLDRFKAVNDTCGHTAGDNMLREIATIIKEAVRDSDTVGRIGGDEFVVLLNTIRVPEHALAVAEKIRASLNQSFQLAEHPVLISASLGIAVYPEHGNEKKQLMRHADSAMYRAKKMGGNRFLMAPLESSSDDEGRSADNAAVASRSEGLA